ncbi:sigma 54-interacting transcriptional regulator [Neobacillus cucumis]|jgi:transcriptional regulator with PAS, ATPase and Fis domain|uniref:sigma 54-interacting transcriptional regulator n=1 Tax=Neobacillus cucumis TaxID=1740721 RepID=UPI002E1A6B0B|nr:sigma 54-interacting transcriptional regulator [Neobacillus cucumis]MED4225026.1 sigma 54-interacting transcriptional regulator [Neobacillus cucumis]
MPLDMQAKLLWVIDNNEVRRHILCKMSQSTVIYLVDEPGFMENGEEGTFREDLYYRMNVIPIHIPH